MSPRTEAQELFSKTARRYQADLDIALAEFLDGIPNEGGFVSKEILTKLVANSFVSGILTAEIRQRSS